MDIRIIRAKLAELQRRAVVETWPITGWQVRTADHLAPGEYRYHGDWAPLESTAPPAIGSWPAGVTVFLRAQAATPEGIPADELCFQYEGSDLEGLLTLDGRPYAGLDEHHTRVVIPAGSHELLIEAMCVPSVRWRPEKRKDRALLHATAFVRVDRQVEAAMYDLWFAWEASKHARDETRRTRLAAALEEALLCVDLTAPGEAFYQEVAAARSVLAERVAAIAPDPEHGGMFLTGHSHIDTAWLWPLRETVRKCGRTFATACRMLERHPHYHFSCSQPQLYEYAQQHFPALYEEIKGWVKAGRWETTGGMWVESDCNVPSGEALIRQVLHGVRFFQAEFGTRPDTCWLPDVFGYPASLPGILLGCGIENFMTNKLHWQARNRFPMALFWWEGIDGTRVLAHIPKLPGGYNGTPDPEQLNQGWDDYPQKTAYPEVLFSYGFGDGGGGPTDTMIESARRAEHYPGVTACRQGLEEQYFDDVRAANPPLPTWVGELYLETHRGTYTTQGALKRANRKNELLLREAEVFSSLAAMQGAAVDTGPLHAAWQNLLLLQFHDILPGSSIGEVYSEAAMDQAAISQAAVGVRDAALRTVASRAGRDQVVAFNSLGWPRTDVALAQLPGELPAGDAWEVVGPDGRAMPAQRVGEAQIAFATEGLLAFGYAAYTVRPAAAPAENRLSVTPQRMENAFFVIELADDGTITRLLDKRAQREVVPAGEVANRLQLFQDGPEREAAWNVHLTYAGREYAWDQGTQVEVVEAGPVRGIVRVTRTYRDSRLVQDIVIYDRVPRIDFVTQADWQERQVMLKAAFPVDVRASEATYEIQFGAVQRPTHRNTSWDEEKFEVCAHRWADLSEPGYGVSLLNDCKYGYDTLGHVLRLTLLRGTEYPDPDADRGHHEFTYALLPHTGEWHDGETVRQGWELNVPVLGLSGQGEQGTLPPAASFVQVEGPAILETLKAAEDGDGWIVRLYEPHGSRGQVTVRLPFAPSAVLACNHVEEGGDPVPTNGQAFSFAIGPFAVRTFRLKSD